MPDYSALACVEEFMEREESADIESGFAARVKLRCAYANRWSVTGDLLLNRRPWPYGGFATPPRASSVSIEPAPMAYGEAGQAVDYLGDALLTVTYSTLKGGDPSTTDLVAESLEPSADFITQSHKNFSWGNVAGGNPLNEAEAPGKQIRSLKLIRTLFQLPNTLPTTIIDLVGSVNDVNYTSALLGLMFPAETLLFLPAGLSRTINTDGSSGWNVTLGFDYRKNTWNKHWRAKTNLFENIWRIDPGGIHKNFPPADFSDWLF